MLVLCSLGRARLCVRSARTRRGARRLFSRPVTRASRISRSAPLSATDSRAADSRAQRFTNNARRQAAVVWEGLADEFAPAASPSRGTRTPRGSNRARLRQRPHLGTLQPRATSSPPRSGCARAFRGASSLAAASPGRPGPTASSGGARASSCALSCRCRSASSRLMEGWRAPTKQPRRFLLERR